MLPYAEKRFARKPIVDVAHGSVRVSSTLKNAITALHGHGLLSARLTRILILAFVLEGA